MLNPTFPKAALREITSPYVAPASIASATRRGNEQFDTGPEYRLQPIYGDEIWQKLERAGISTDNLRSRSVLEVCAGTGFLTFHLLSRAVPKSLTVNDISLAELRAARQLVAERYPEVAVNWMQGDMHTLSFPGTFDLIIGNSFLHHFHDVPRVLSRIHALLSPGGVFISLHEPTPMSTVVEGAKVLAYPLALLAPAVVNDIARARYRGAPSSTDLWMFEHRPLKQVAEKTGFSTVDIHPWHLFRPIIVQRRSMHLSSRKPQLSDDEIVAFRRALTLDGFFSRFLPSHCFGSICIACRK